MDINTFFNQVVEWLNKNNIHFKTLYQDAPLKLQSLRATKGNKLKIVFENGVAVVARGVQIARDTVTIPFDLVLQSLNGLVSKERQVNVQNARPIVITLFSVFSLLSIFALFALIKFL